jgi:hypothetical protein
MKKTSSIYDSRLAQYTMYGVSKAIISLSAHASVSTSIGNLKTGIYLVQVLVNGEQRTFKLNKL